MAGSYNHVVTKSGKLNTPERICGMLECRSGDVVECVEEMFGMIWLLADQAARAGYLEGAWEELSPEAQQQVRAGWVEEARQRYKDGIALSPGSKVQRGRRWGR